MEGFRWHFRSSSLVSPYLLLSLFLLPSFIYLCVFLFSLFWWSPWRTFLGETFSPSQSFNFACLSFVLESLTMGFLIREGKNFEFSYLLLPPVAVRTLRRRGRRRSRREVHENSKKLFILFRRSCRKSLQIEMDGGVNGGDDGADVRESKKLEAKSGAKIFWRICLSLSMVWLVDACSDSISGFAVFPADLLHGVAEKERSAGNHSVTISMRLRDSTSCVAKSTDEDEIGLCHVICSLGQRLARGTSFIHIHEVHGQGVSCDLLIWGKDM